VSSLSDGNFKQNEGMEGSLTLIFNFLMKYCSVRPFLMSLVFLDRRMLGVLRS